VQNRVAVLYFTDESRDSSLRYLADGFTETLIDQLSTIHALDVVSRRRRPVRDATCRVTRSRARSRPYTRRGSVEPVGSRARVTIRLVDGASSVSAASEFRVTDRRTPRVAGFAREPGGGISAGTARR